MLYDGFLVFLNMHAYMHTNPDIHRMIIGFTRKNHLHSYWQKQNRKQNPVSIYNGRKTAFPVFKSGMSTIAKNLLQCHILQRGRESVKG